MKGHSLPPPGSYPAEDPDEDFVFGGVSVGTKTIYTV